MGDLKNTVLTKEQVLNDPYGYTYNEILQVLGENTSKSLMADLYRKKAKNAHYTIKVKDYYNGKDTTKYAFEMEDGYCIETVCIKRRTGTTICISTMVGCPVGCIFCASGKNGFIRNLTPSEIVQQVVMVKEKINRIVVDIRITLRAKFLTYIDEIVILHRILHLFDVSTLVEKARIFRKLILQHKPRGRHKKKA